MLVKRSNIYLFVAALILTAALAVPAAAQKPVKMRFSGSNVATTINLRPNTVTDETQLAGNGSLGTFTFRELHADGPSLQPLPGCSGPHFAVVAQAYFISKTEGYWSSRLLRVQVVLIPRQ